MIIYPTLDMGVLDWASQMSYLVMSQTPFERLDDPSKWQEWGMNFVGEPTQLGQDAPDPYGFDNWREWAEQLFYTHDFEG